MHCSKAFINASFLHAHIARRHPESAHVTVPFSREAVPLSTLLCAPVTEATRPSAGKAVEFAHELEEICERLQNTEAQLVQERNSHLELLKKVCVPFVLRQIL